MRYKNSSYRVTIKENKLGDLEIELVNKKIRKKYKRLIIKEHKRSVPQLHVDWQIEEFWEKQA